MALKTGIKILIIILSELVLTLFGFNHASFAAPTAVPLDFNSLPITLLSPTSPNPDANTPSVTYVADGTSSQYQAGLAYTATLTINNPAGSTLASGTKIMIQLPLKGVDITSFAFNNTLFSVSKDQQTGIATLTLINSVSNQTTISGQIAFTVSWKVGTFQIGITTQDPKGQNWAIVHNQSPTFSVFLPNFSYSFINTFFGTRIKTTNGIVDSKTSNFKNELGSDLDNMPTGLFYRQSNQIQNFIEVNKDGKLTLSPTGTYDFTWSIAPDNSHPNARIDILPDLITVYSEKYNHQLASKDYDVAYTPGSHSVTVHIHSNQASQGDVRTDGAYVVNFFANVYDDAVHYRTSSSATAQEDGQVIQTDKYADLNNVFFFDTTSSSIFPNIFPNITAEDTTFATGTLTDANLKQQLLSIGGTPPAISASDAIDGNISANIQVDSAQITGHYQTPGTYPVVLSVENSRNLTSESTINVTLVQPVAGNTVIITHTPNLDFGRHTLPHDNSEWVVANSKLDLNGNIPSDPNGNYVQLTDSNYNQDTNWTLTAQLSPWQVASGLSTDKNLPGSSIDFQTQASGQQPARDEEMIAGGSPIVLLSKNGANMYKSAQIKQMYNQVLLKIPNPWQNVDIRKYTATMSYLVTQSVQ